MSHGPTRRTTVKTVLGVAGALAAGANPLATASAHAAPTTPTTGTGARAADPDRPVLRYGAPATDWETESLPVGNGALGASVFGTLPTEHIQFAEKTLWTGGPGTPGYRYGNWENPRPDALASVRADIEARTKITPEDAAARLGQLRIGYGGHQTFGDLLIDVDGAPGSAEGYTRTLDLAQALATVSYPHDGTTFHRTVFASCPDKVLVGHFTADRGGSVGLNLRYTSPRQDFTATTNGDRLTVRGALQDNGMRFEAQIRLLSEGGTVTANGDRLTVSGADSAWFVLSAGTDYADTYPDYRGADPHDRVTTAVDQAAARPYRELLDRHTSDHAALFSRVVLDLGQDSAPDRTTDALLKAYTGGNSADDRALEALFFQYGRYLLIASSRAGSLPANLQGAWNNSTAPPWSADYHVNINLQMNYWPAEATNLAETTAPYDRFVEALRAPGRTTARSMFDARGWVVHDETTPFGFTGVHDWPTSFWFPEAAAWLTSQLYEHYRFDGSTDYLRATAYPAMKEAAEFWIDVLRTDPRDNTLVVTPSFSPEHGDFTAGAAMSQQIVRELFLNTLEAAQTLGDDPAFRATLKETLDRIDPGLRIGSWGQLMEWKTDLDGRTDDHRHVSHLYALHPGRQIEPGSDFAEAAKVSLTARGDGGTGWSKAWKINFWARLRDGDHAHTMLAEQLKGSTLANLWDTHPPFQIDGNFGATSGITEMLLQSQHDVIEVLPALPAAWSSGTVRGLRARGGATLEFSWENGRATRIALTASRTRELTVRNALVPGGTTTFKAVAGETYTWE
ncbi:glycoside hydrolase family 95 protein [Streptomyces sp. AM 3-1-1]|uniref:glycoside hydrolase family 95 protein n=1 Tax=Streptomyces sp. AM 3-1-1 TaxID=3028711 RepID=UPI0023BA234A|nr:glycoside hydrolase family 95 protein [Streptomyces sp. AM 3-1-1]WEH31435.1 glycoside hydrolase family 95 protein [Streptomyces sp. AM 3-1-1]